MLVRPEAIHERDEEMVATNSKSNDIIVRSGETVEVRDGQTAKVYDGGTANVFEGARLIYKGVAWP